MGVTLMEDSEKNFRRLCWVALPAYPIAFCATWSRTSVDHEVEPLWLCVIALLLAMVTHACGVVLRRCMAGILLNWRRKPPEKKDDTQRYLARSWKIVEVVCLTLI